jgi:hypothetical protein
LGCSASTEFQWGGHGSSTIEETLDEAFAYVVFEDKDALNEWHEAQTKHLQGKVSDKS